MKYKCMMKSMLRGDLVKVGEVVDLNEVEAQMDVVKAYFVAVEDAAPIEDSVGAVSAKSEKRVKAGTVVAGLTREQAMMKLTQAGVKAKGNMSNAALAALYEATFANIAEASEKKGE